MRKPAFFVAAILLGFSYAHAQIKTPERRSFNIGIFSGIGGVNFTPIPGVDLQYRGNILRVAPGYKAFGAGYIREILPLSEAFYNWYWIASLYGAMEKEDHVHPSPDPRQTLSTTYYRGILLTGVKVYFARRLYSQLQAGISYTEDHTPTRSNTSQLIPYFEFSFGINLFKSFLNEEQFE